MISLHTLADTTRKVAFLMVDSTDHLTGKTGLTPTVTRRKLGGSFAALSGSVAEIASGWYEITFASGDVDTIGELLIHVTGTAADPVDMKIQVVSINPYDSVRLGLTALPNAAAGANGGLPLGNASGHVTPADDSITAAKIATGAIDADAIAADAVTEIQSGLATAAALTTVDDFLDTEVAAILAIAQKLDTALELDGAVYRFTVNALEQGPSGGGGVADWTADERTAIRAILGIPASGTTPEEPSAGAIKVIDDFLDTEVAAIKAKTDNLPTDPADESAIQAAIAAVAAQVTTVDDFLDTEIAAIKAKTDNLPASPAAVGSAMTLSAAERENLRGYSLSGTTLTFPEGATATVVITDGQIVSITPD